MLRNLHGITIQQQQEGGHRPADLKRPRSSPASPIRQLVLGENIREIHIFLTQNFLFGICCEIAFRFRTATASKILNLMKKQCMIFRKGARNQYGY